MRWRFVEVLQIHGGVDGEDLNGKEVMTNFPDVEIDVSCDSELHPEKSEPHNS